MEKSGKRVFCSNAPPPPSPMRLLGLGVFLFMGPGWGGPQRLQEKTQLASEPVLGLGRAPLDGPGVNPANMLLGLSTDSRIFQAVLVKL